MTGVSACFSGSTECTCGKKNYVGRENSSLWSNCKSKSTHVGIPSDNPLMCLAYLHASERNLAGSSLRTAARYGKAVSVRP
eukprot:1007308-Pelagomonas_calceolata.AAC.1